MNSLRPIYLLLVKDFAADVVLIGVPYGVHQKCNALQRKNKEYWLYAQSLPGFDVYLCKATLNLM